MYSIFRVYIYEGWMKGAWVSINDNVLVIKTKMMLGQFEVEKIRQKIIKDAEEGVVIIPGFFDAEIIQKPDDVIIECLKIEEDSNGNC